MVSTEPPRYARIKIIRYGNTVRKVASAPIDVAAVRDVMFRAMQIPAASRIAPAMYPHALGNGIQDGIGSPRGTPGAKVG